MTDVETIRGFDRIVINILKALWKSRKLAWTDGKCQQGDENMRKNQTKMIEIKMTDEGCF